MPSACLPYRLVEFGQRPPAPGAGPEPTMAGAPPARARGATGRWQDGHGRRDLPSLLIEALAFLLLMLGPAVAWPQGTAPSVTTLPTVTTLPSETTVPPETTLHYREGQRIDPEQVRQILSAPPPATGRTRSIRLLDGDARDGASAEPTTSARALSAPVQFEFDSSLILPQAREQLDAIAEGIKLLPAGRTVVIEGHTDAAGSDDYNQQLSRRRAAAVKQYLTQRHGIAPQRLRDVGLGERQPIDGLDPMAPDNRRVQFRGG